MADVWPIWRGIPDYKHGPFGGKEKVQECKKFPTTTKSLPQNHRSFMPVAIKKAIYISPEMEHK